MFGSDNYRYEMNVVQECWGSPPASLCEVFEWRHEPWHFQVLTQDVQPHWEAQGQHAEHHPLLQRHHRHGVHDGTALWGRYAQGFACRNTRRCMKMLSPHTGQFSAQPGAEEGESGECGDLISPQPGLGVTLGFSQHNYRGRKTHGDWKRKPSRNNPFLMKHLLFIFLWFKFFSSQKPHEILSQVSRIKRKSKCVNTFMSTLSVSLSVCQEEKDDLKMKFSYKSQNSEQENESNI